MINRVIIRVKVLLIIYAYYQKSSNDLASTEKELVRSMEKSYDLYHFLLWLIVVLTDFEQKRLDAVKHKYLPTKEELNPDTRLVNNRLAEQLRVNKTLRKYALKQDWFSGEEDRAFIRRLAEKIHQSEIYAAYLQSVDTYVSDREFWRRVFKNIILEDEEITDFIEEKNIYWDGNLEVVGTFALKTIKQIEEESNENHELLPMYKDETTRQFAIQLLHRSILEQEENKELIDRQIKNWDLERIALMDLLIMQMAIAELKNFPSIPVNVTLNEYIDLARYYSTPKSSHFINGILDSIVTELKNEGKIFKS
ncbi:N utilization substance protein B [Bacteroidia bacterium]|nr:N utilization substance protein B [Bacteroidia bacterium]